MKKRIWKDERLLPSAKIRRANQGRVAKRILICDDDLKVKTTLKRSLRLLEQAGFKVSYFNGRLRAETITDAGRLSSAMLTRIGEGYEGLVMDLGWWDLPVSFGLNVLRQIAPVLPKHLPLQRVAVLTKHIDTLKLLDELQAIGIPPENVFSKWDMDDDEWSNFLSIFA